MVENFVRQVIFFVFSFTNISTDFVLYIHNMSLINLSNIKIKYIRLIEETYITLQNKKI